MSVTSLPFRAGFSTSNPCVQSRIHRLWNAFEGSGNATLWSGKVPLSPERALSQVLSQSRPEEEGEEAEPILEDHVDTSVKPKRRAEELPGLKDEGGESCKGPHETHQDDGSTLWGERAPALEESLENPYQEASGHVDGESPPGEGGRVVTPDDPGEAEAGKRTDRTGQGE